ncbi:MAG: hypothetical protein XXXJIFNMEKO3_00832 [Candidatus Erwinia impunctatus]|nr:hypothetical protein XXXJIFNMEKO_00832 [Culicoides impunctatus]
MKIEKAISHEEIPQLLSTFDYGIIPFKVNELTNSVDPVKYYEYEAADLKIISSSFGEMSWRVEKGSVADFENYKSFKYDKKIEPVFWFQRFSDVLKKILNTDN